MDQFGMFDEKKPARKKITRVLLWNVLTILVLVMSLCVLSVYFLIYMDPNSVLNPFPPPTLFPTFAQPTPTITLRFTLVPSWTPTSEVIQATDTPAPTHTPIVTDTPVASPTPLGSVIPSTPGEFAFVVQPGSPSAISWTTFHPDAGCDWTGVAGQATSLNGEAVRGLFVQLGGSMPGVDTVNKQVMTGLAEEYGPGGFEITVANEMLASDGTLWIQLLDQQNLPLSDRVYFNTFADCEKNLIIIYFDQVR